MYVSAFGSLLPCREDFSPTLWVIATLSD